MSPDLPLQTPAPFKSRRGWLIVFGVIEILIAGSFLLLLALMLVGLLTLSHSSRPVGTPELSVAGAVFAVLFYGGLGVLFLMLGVGSIKCKNWGPHRLADCERFLVVHRGLNKSFFHFRFAQGY